MCISSFSLKTKKFHGAFVVRWYDKCVHLHEMLLNTHVE